MSTVSVSFRTGLSHVCKINTCQNSLRYKTTTSTSAAEYCLDLVRNLDHENFLCTLLLPSHMRSVAFAVRAFNVEVAKIQDHVSQIQTGQMRLQFWLDTVDKIFKNEVRDHPVAIELYRTVKDQTLSKKHLKNLITSRINPINSTSFKTIEDMEKYAELSVSSVYYIILQSTGLGSVHTDHAASHLGKSQGITNLLRSIPYSASSRVVPLPQDLLLKYNLSHEAILRAKNEAELKQVVYDIACRAKQHLDKARNLKKDCPKGVTKLFLPAVCIDSFLNRLQKADFNIFDKHLHRRNNVLPVQLYWNKLLDKY